jgi:hypothetical protein
MKKVSRILLLSTLSLLFIFLCAFEIDKDSSLKDFTHPYINTYVCTKATLGNEDLLEKYEYVTITILNTSELEVAFKKTDGKRHSYTCNYQYDKKTKELSAEVGILGFTFREKTVIENGKFTISFPILSKQLIMIFQTK